MIRIVPQQYPLIGLLLPVLAWITTVVLAATASAEPLNHIRVSDDKTHFVHGESAERFIVRGVTYDHDRAGRLLDEYWIDEWATVVEDFGEMKAFGVNCVRIHLQPGLFLDSPDTPNVAALQRWRSLQSWLCPSGRPAIPRSLPLGVASKAARAGRHQS